MKDLVDEGLLHSECAKIFRKGKSESEIGATFTLHKHQEEAIRMANNKENFVLTTGTGSGKSLCYIIPIVNYVLQKGSGKNINAIIVYPMNALANSQKNELEKFLCHGYPIGQEPVTFRRYTGQEKDDERKEIIENPPDILLTNYVMLELLLTRPGEHKLIQAAKGLKFLVFDELHTYRGRQGADVALLIRRTKNRLDAEHLQCIGTSATISGTGTIDEQRAEVAKVATTMFGSEFKAENIIGETLRKVTPETDLETESFNKGLRESIKSDTPTQISIFAEFVKNPLSIWLENTLGVQKDELTGRLVRAQPKSIYGKDGIAKNLCECTGFDEKKCGKAIQDGLLAGYHCEPNPETGFPPFAFRLHQFIGRGDTVYATIEEENMRFNTVYPQRTHPNDSSKILYPLLFCRECGQEYYSVWRCLEDHNQKDVFSPRSIMNPVIEEEGESGFLYLSSTYPFPLDGQELLNRLPDDWLEEHDTQIRINPQRKDDIPQPFSVVVTGEIDSTGTPCHYIKSPFLFCLNCGVSYTPRQSDFTKLASLNSGGRSTSTTILSLSTIRHIRKSKTETPSIPDKLLSFTDNRQDASLPVREKIRISRFMKPK